METNDKLNFDIDLREKVRQKEMEEDNDSLDSF